MKFIMKYILLVSLCLFTGPLLSELNASANTRSFGAITATLDYKTNLGAARSFTLLLKDNEIIVDGVQLNAVQKSRAAPYLTRLLQTVSKSPLRSCASGSFTHVVKLHAKSSVEQGCLDSIAFAELNRSFEMLQRPGY